MKKTGKKKLIIILLVVAACIGVSLRIIYVNKHARLPEYKVYARGESIEKDGFSYAVEDATLYHMSDFEKVYNDGRRYMSGRTDDDLLILVVRIRLDVVGDTNTFNVPDNYLESVDVLSMVDNDNFAVFNPSLADGTFRSGGSLNYVFCLYKENYAAKDWKRIKELRMDYEIVYSGYPVRASLDVGTVSWYRASDAGKEQGGK